MRKKKLGDCEVRKVKLSSLKPAEYNPRNITDDAKTGLKASIERFGVVQPIIWNEQTGNIVGGHQRFYLLKEKKVKQTQVVVVDLDQAEEVQLNLTLNNTNNAGYFTNELLDLLQATEENDPNAYDALCMDGLRDLLPAQPKQPDSDVKTTGTSEQVEFVMGDLKFSVSIGKYNDWLAQLRQEVGETDRAVITMAKARLRL